MFERQIWIAARQKIFIAFTSVCHTPQASGTPTKAQNSTAVASSPPLPMPNDPAAIVPAAPCSSCSAATLFRLHEPFICQRPDKVIVDESANQHCGQAVQGHIVDVVTRNARRDLELADVIDHNRADNSRRRPRGQKTTVNGTDELRAEDIGQVHRNAEQEERVVGVLAPDIIGQSGPEASVLDARGESRPVAWKLGRLPPEDQRNLRREYYTNLGSVASAYSNATISFVFGRGCVVELHDREADVRLEPTPPIVNVRRDCGAHTRIPELLYVIGGAGDGLL